MSGQDLHLAPDNSTIFYLRDWEKTGWKGAAHGTFTQQARRLRSRLDYLNHTLGPAKSVRNSSCSCRLSEINSRLLSSLMRCLKPRRCCIFSKASRF